MNKIYLLLTLCLILGACASKEHKTSQEYVQKMNCPSEPVSTEGDVKDTSDCTLEVSLPSTPKKVEVAQRWIKLGAQRNLEFVLGISPGKYSIRTTPLDGISPGEAEMILNIKHAGATDVESLSLVKTSEDLYQGFGASRRGKANFNLVYKVPGQKEIVLDFELEVM